MENKSDFYMGIGLLTICTIFAQQIWLLPKPNATHFFTAATFPIAVLTMLALCSGVLIIKAFKKTTQVIHWPSRAVLGSVGAVMALIVLYVSAFILIGEYSIQEGWKQGSVFCATTALFILAAQLVCGAANMKRAGIIAVGMTVVLFIIFSLLFNVPLP